jgi:hypothetical protein
VKKIKIRKKTQIMWEQRRLIKILKWKYRRKSIQGNNIIIASRFYYPMSKKESKWKEMAEND